MEGVWLIEKLEVLFANFGYPLIFVTSFIESSPFGWATPGATLLFMGGFFSKGEGLAFELVLLSGYMGTWLMLLLGYHLGGRSGVYLANKFGQEKNAERAKRLLAKHGGLILTTTLTSNMTRFWVSYVAGSREYKFSKFLLYSAIASATWVVIWTTAGFVAGVERSNIEKLLPRIGIFSWVILLVALIVTVWSSKKDYEEIAEQGDEKK